MASSGSSASHDPEPSAPRIERAVDLDAGLDEVWSSIVGADELGSWLGERVEIDMQPGGCGHVVDEGVRRDVLVTAVEPGRRVAWHWWEDGGELSSVEITLVPTERGTRVRVVEIAARAAAPADRTGRPGPLALASVGGTRAAA